MSAHLREDWSRRIAATLRPLLVGPTTFYRIHPSGRPFSKEDANSEVFDRASLPQDVQDVLKPMAGYSCFANPWHLLQYAEDMGWLDQEDEYGLRTTSDPVVRFEGEQVGKGYDGEPVVMPTSGIEERISFSDFRDRLEVTSVSPFPRWDG